MVHTLVASGAHDQEEVALTLVFVDQDIEHGHPPQRRDEDGWIVSLIHDEGILG